MFLFPSVEGGGDERQGSGGVGPTSDSCRSPSGERPSDLWDPHATRGGVIIPLAQSDVNLTHMAC